VFCKEDLTIFLYEFVSVGVPHSTVQGQLFFYYGKLKEVTEKEIKLETKTGLRLISIENIIDIHLDRRKNNYDISI
jgi:hypothetical protein